MIAILDSDPRITIDLPNNQGVSATYAALVAAFSSQTEDDRDLEHGVTGILESSLEYAVRIVLYK
jgi:hypothetical protein